MIYLDVNLDVWLQKYPDLKVVEGLCNNCGAVLKSERPFITKEYVGLTSDNCRECSSSSHKAMTFISYDKSKVDEWNKLLSYL